MQRAAPAPAKPTASPGLSTLGRLQLHLPRRFHRSRWPRTQRQGLSASGLNNQQSGGGFRPYLQRLNFLYAISNVMPQVIDLTDLGLDSTGEGFWTCQADHFDHFGAGSFDTPKKGAPAKHRWEFFFAPRLDSPISRESSPRLVAPRTPFVEALEGAEIDPVSGMVLVSFDHGLRLRLGLGIREIVACHF